MDNNILYRLTKVGTERQVASFSFASASDSKIFEISCTLQYNGVCFALPRSLRRSKGDSSFERLSHSQRQELTQIIVVP